eukprot:2314067-Amphidinium_carterae.2
MIHGWTSRRVVAPLGFDLRSHFRRWRCQAVAKQLIPGRCNTTILRRLGLWCPRRCGKAVRARVREIPDERVKEVSPVTAIQDLYAVLNKAYLSCGRALAGSCCPFSRGGSGHRHRGARAMMSSAADRCEMPCRGSSTMACNQHNAAATSVRLRRGSSD